MMSDMRGAVAVAGPVTAGMVFVIVECGAVDSRASENVVTIRIFTRAPDLIAAFIQCRFPVDIRGIAVQFVDVPGDQHACGVVPGTIADSIARIRALDAQVGAPGSRAGADRAAEELTMRIGAFQAAEIRAVARSVTGYKEAHRIVLCGADAETGDQRRGEKQSCRSFHRFSTVCCCQSKSAADIGDDSMYSNFSQRSS